MLFLNGGTVVQSSENTQQDRLMNLNSMYWRLNSPLEDLSIRAEVVVHFRDNDSTKLDTFVDCWMINVSTEAREFEYMMMQSVHILSRLRSRGGKLYKLQYPGDSKRMSKKARTECDRSSPCFRDVGRGLLQSL